MVFSQSLNDNTLPLYSDLKGWTKQNLPSSQRLSLAVGKSLTFSLWPWNSLGANRLNIWVIKCRTRSFKTFLGMVSLFSRHMAFLNILGQFLNVCSGRPVLWEWGKRDRSRTLCQTLLHIGCVRSGRGIHSGWNEVWTDNAMIQWASAVQWPLGSYCQPS